MSSVTSHAGHTERPERSRNAKAQARHRAKRKAYIEQLEQTVTKLQTALGYSPEDVSAMPPPLIKIRELEQDVARLEKENEDLRRILSDSGRLSVDIPRRNSLSSFQDTRGDQSYKRRKMGGVEGAYISPTDTPPQLDALSRPPPLTIPQPMSHHYSHISPNPSHNSSTMYSLHAPAFQMPNTPSGSSATSSPPFSPTQMQEPLHSPANHRPPILNDQVMSNYSHRTNHYGPVKVEEDHYASSHQHQQHNGHYPIASQYTHPAPDNTMNSWNGYSSERAHMHR
ncbi:hypothetical protein BDZ94DRAFT_1271043 [Collybia nuda]|uniref:BZIP domain-containing protein n=1 Tax=Collybia nuda TaxID=64659 RepID=A0A9P5XWU4_9AGAR|nr:hypothetical protein BDZ94DRAFT_1271043 [Collybia nuda]